MQTKSFFWKRGQCRAIRLLLWDYASNRISEGPLETVEKHLADCEACRAELASLSRAQQLLCSARQNPPPSPRSDWHTLRARLEALPTPALQAVHAQRRASLWQPAFQTAALAVLCVALGSGSTYMAASLRPASSSLWPSKVRQTDASGPGQPVFAPFSRANRATEIDKLQVSLVTAIMKAQPICLQDPTEVRDNGSPGQPDKTAARAKRPAFSRMQQNDRLIPVQHFPGPVRPDDSMPHFKHYTPQPDDAPELVDSASPKPGPYEPVGMPFFQPDGHDGEHPY